MISCGQQLRQARLEQGLAMEKVQEETKIRRRHLEALENDEPDPGVGRVYYRAFLRTYAAYLGLDPAPLLEQFAPIAPEPEPEEAPVPVRRRSRAPILLLVLALAVASFFAIRWLTAADPVADPPAPPPPQVTPDPPLAPGVPPPRIVREDPHPGRTNLRVDATNVELVLRLGSGEEDRSWVRVQADGARVFEGTLPPGTTVAYRAQRELLVRLGRPWAVTLELNGVQLGPAGPVGPVKDLHVSTGR